jgi:hypothetical protein
MVEHRPNSALARWEGLGRSSSTATAVVLTQAALSGSQAAFVRLEPNNARGGVGSPP